jgi:CBS domain-containing protein
MRQLATLFTKQVIVASKGDTIGRVAEMMQEQNVGAIVVIEQQRPVGIVTDRDIAIALGSMAISIGEPVESIMSSPVATISQEKDVLDATQYMRANMLRRMPVVDGAGHLVGLVTLDDLLILLTREMANLAESVRQEISLPTVLAL